MRRRYYNNNARKKVRMEALLTMKKARREIDPALLEKAQKAIADAWFARKENGGAEEPANAREYVGSVPVDVKKNLSVIQKFIEMNGDNKALQQQVKAMISDTF